jgi:two-component sensor histidine kinase/ABC-type amino acid transport substrate-binding protein
MKGKRKLPLLQALLLTALLVAGVPDYEAVAEKSPDISPSGSDDSKAFLETLSEKERQWLREHPVIRVALDPSSPPIKFTDSKGELSGISSDYLKIVERRLGVKFEQMKNMTWQQAFDRLKRWEIDMAPSLADTDERRNYLIFTKPYLTIPIVTAAHRDVTYLGSMKELSGRKVAIVEDHAVSEWIPRDWPAIKLIKVKTVHDGLTLLQREEVFAYIDNLIIIGYYQARMKVTDIKIAGETPYINSQAMAVRKDWPILAGILQKALDSISESERNDIYRRWLPIRYEHGFDYSLLWKALGIFAAALIGLLLWNQKLAGEISSRRKAEVALRDSEARLRLSLDQKEALLRELYHRTNNSMQVIRSILVLRAASLNNPEITSFVRKIDEKILAMALVQQKLYQSQNLSRVDLGEYLPELASLLIENYELPDGFLTLALQSEPVLVLIDTAIPCGLAVSELISNAVRHAFPGRKTGTIRMKIGRNPSGSVEVFFADDGIGMPADFDFRKNVSGLRTVYDLVESQMKGEIVCEQAEGLAYTIRFSDNLYEQRV